MGAICSVVHELAEVTKHSLDNGLNMRRLVFEPLFDSIHHFLLVQDEILRDRFEKLLEVRIVLVQIDRLESVLIFGIFPNLFK